MKHLLTGLEKYGIGRRALTEQDFWHIIEVEQITVLYCEDDFAFMFTMMGRKFLTLPKRRKGLRRLFSMFHELGHLLLMNGNQPIVAFQDLECEKHSKAEAEADAIALVALMPKHLLKEMAWLDGSRYGSHLYNERLRLYFLYGI